MGVRSWDPLGDLLRLQERLNLLLQASVAPHRLEAAAEGAWTPAADAWETAEAFIIQLDVPGVDEGDITLEVQGERLTVRGRRQALARGASFHLVERSSGAFVRTFMLPERPDPERVRVTLRDGLLRIEAPKARGRRTRGEKGA
jgi:HSP20 family protein